MFINTVVTLSILSLPIALTQLFELVVDVVSKFDIVDTFLFAHDTLAFVVVIVAHRLETLIPFAEAHPELVASEKKIKQELFG